MIYIDNDTTYSQRIYIPKDEDDSLSGVTGHTVAYQSKDYVITENGTTNIHPDAGYDAITGGSIGVYVTAATGITPEHLEATEDGLYVPTGNTVYTGVTVQVYDSAYQDGYGDGFDSGYTSGYTSGTTDGYASGSTDGFETGYASGYTDGFEAGHASGYTEGYQSGYTRGNSEGYSSGYTDGYASGLTSGQSIGYASGYTNGYNEGYASGYTSGMTSGKTIGYASGYTSGCTDGFASGYTSGLTIGYASGYTSGYTDGYASGYTSGQTIGYSSGYTSGQTDGYNSGYTVGYQTGWNAGYVSGHTEGYDAGYLSGHTDGMEAQKALLSAETLTENGYYYRENGLNEITVALPMASIVQGCNSNGRYTLSASTYDLAGFTEATFDVDVDQVGPYNEGYSSGYTDGYSSGYTSGYTSGHTAGYDEREALISDTYININGQFTSDTGWSGVTVDVPTTVNNRPLAITADTQWYIDHQSSPAVYYPGNGYSGFNMVSIDTQGVVISGNHTISNPLTSNGTHTVNCGNVYANNVTVDVAVPMQQIRVTQNGTYTPLSGGYSSVEVAVSGGGSASQIVTCTQAQYDALNPPDPSIIYLIKD